MAIEIITVFITRNTTYVVAQGATGQYIGRFNTEAVSLYTAESGIAAPKVGQQAVLHILDHDGRYDRLITSTVKDVVMDNGALKGITAFLAATFEIGATLGFAQRQEELTAKRHALTPAL